MKFNILYGKHENLSQIPLQEGNLYITDIGYMYMDIVNSNNELVRSEIVGKRDWNALEGDNGYVHNRTHWSEPEKVTIIEETTSPSLMEFIQGIPAYEWEPIGEDFRTLFSNLITSGMTCIVTIDGVEYESIAYEVPTGYYEHCVVVGDSRLYYEHFGEFDGLPEEVASLNPQDVPFAIVNIVAVDGLIPEAINYTHDISVVTVPEGATFKLEKLTGNSIYHPLQEEYVPSTIARVNQIVTPDWATNDVDDASYIQNRTHYYGDVLYEYLNAKNVVNNRPFNRALINYKPWLTTPQGLSYNQKFIVEIDGVSYETTSWKNTDGLGSYWFALGDSKLTASDNDEITALHPEEVPFIIEYFYEEGHPESMQYYEYWQASFAEDEIEPHDIKIYVCENYAEHHKIDDKYLPAVDWNAEYGENGYIEQRTHYKERELFTIFNRVTINQYYNDFSFAKDIEDLKEITELYNGQVRAYNPMGVSYEGTFTLSQTLTRDPLQGSFSIIIDSKKYTPTNVSVDEDNNIELEFSKGTIYLSQNTKEANISGLSEPLDASLQILFTYTNIEQYELSTYNECDVIFDRIHYKDLPVWSYENPEGNIYFAVGDSRLTKIGVKNQDGSSKYDQDGNLIVTTNYSNPSQVPFAIIFKGSKKITYYGTTYQEYYYEIYSNLSIIDGITLAIPTGNQKYYTLDANYLPESTALTADLQQLIDDFNANY